ncbi:hypothetical protein EXE46_15535 [Halorubrum sp. GN11_10-6_MGM]|uniref:hypothetical protein n=1 Tax=Halorubrum sp. GN11_10-6_MGM TaxID=2518112 RepID=UPI0010F61CD9|nr:hypothetical protein [Halorubrum sp. GN11_10-6_MGM]TKX72731.1 hypothetical protein EXE46_15535 [Halorubrum sp. GN11_10-6_MGM]
MANRRSVLIGLGGLVAGGGALLGTGAFTTVEADRTVNIQSTGDASAFLALTPARSSGNYVDNSTDTIEIDLDGTDSNNDAASGLNENARTRFENLVDITNNGTQNVDKIAFEVEETALSDSTESGNHEEAFKIVTGGDTLNPLSGSEVDLFSSNDVSGPLTPGGTTTFGVEIDLLDSSITEIDSSASFTLTIIAETANSN